MISIIIENRLGEIPAALNKVDAFLEREGADGGAKFDIMVALEEMLTNIVSYGQTEDAAERISLTLSADDGVATCTLSDRGVPFNPLSTPAPDLTAGIEARQVGGLGIHFVRQLMQSVAYSRIDGRNVLTMGRSLRC